MIPNALLDLLVCPATKQPVKTIAADKLDKINQQIRGGALRNLKGDSITEELEEALIREDGRVVYPVRSGIPIMLVDESFEVPGSSD